jgi:hypothetical protein
MFRDIHHIVVCHTVDQLVLRIDIVFGLGHSSPICGHDGHTACSLTPADCERDPGMLRARSDRNPNSGRATGGLWSRIISEACRSTWLYEWMDEDSVVDS